MSLTLTLTLKLIVILECPAGDLSGKHGLMPLVQYPDLATRTFKDPSVPPIKGQFLALTLPLALTLTLTLIRGSPHEGPIRHCIDMQRLLCGLRQVRD